MYEIGQVVTESSRRRNSVYEIGQVVTDEDGTKNEVVAIEEVESEEGRVLTVIRWRRVEGVGGETTD